MTKQFTITVDTEEEWDWHAGYRTDSQAVQNIAGLDRFHAACESHDAKVTYFVNHTVLANSSSLKTIEGLAARDDVEIGLHIHPWNTPPLSESVEVSEFDSFLGNLPREIAIEKLNVVLELFRKLGLEPTSYRGGRYSTTDWIQKHLVSNGFVADASILPFTTWKDNGAPDYRHRYPVPERRSFGDDGAIWEIPLTLAWTRNPWLFWHRLYQVAERPLMRNLRMVGIAERLFVRRVWLNLEHPLGEHSVQLLEQLRSYDTPCVNLTLHSSSLLPGLNPYVRTQSDLDGLFARLDSVLAYLNSSKDYQSATVSEVARNLENNHHACARNQPAR